MYTDVVPLRGTPATRDMFEYYCPDGLVVRPGQVVRVPFGPRSIQGIVWRTKVLSEINAPKVIQGVVGEGQVVTDWQIRLLEHMHMDYGASRSVLLKAIVPTRNADMRGTAGRISAGVAARDVVEYDWVGGQDEMIKAIRTRLKRDNPTVVLCPTVEIAERVQQLLGVVTRRVTGKTSVAEYAKAYAALLAGDNTPIVGTVKAIWLPYLQAPNIVVCHEEHPSYKNHERHPYFDIVRLLVRRKYNVSLMSAAPRLRSYAVYRPLAPTFPVARVLAPLAGNHVQWLSPVTEAALRSGGFRSLLWIVPRTGYAGAMVCRTCGQPVACGTCGWRVRIAREDSVYGRCAHCGSTSAVPTACSKCHGTTWRFEGLGQRRFSELLRRARLIHSTVKIEEIGGYRLFDQIDRFPTPRFVCVVSGDAMRSIPDFAGDERVWQRLLRTESELQIKDCMCVQTFVEADVFWQRWVNKEHRAWYEDALRDRRRLELPPAVDQCIIEPSVGVREGLEANLKNLRLKWPKANVTELPGFRVRGRRWLLTSGQAGQHFAQDVREVFGARWLIDRDIDSWLG